MVLSKVPIKSLKVSILSVRKIRKWNIRMMKLEVVQSFNRKFGTSEEKAIPDSESFGTEDSHVSIPNFDNSNANIDNCEQSSPQLTCACSGFESQRWKTQAKKSKAD